MRVHRLLLDDFRSYDRADIALSPGFTAFVGPNGAGKTNLLEAIHVLARGESPRAHDDAEMVRWGATMARAAAECVRDDRLARIETLLFSPVQGERRRPRRYLVDGAGKRAEDVLGRIVVVAFFPEDVDLLTEAPSARRRYLDAMIGQVERRHRADTREHQRVVEQRNALLRALRDEQAEPDHQLDFWDGELCRLGAAISLRRMRAVHEIRHPFREAIERWSGEHLVDVAYATPAEGETEAERASSYQRLVEEKREKEMWQGTTLVGPHREDLAVTSSGRDLPSFASRGEQRSVVLALKVAEATWLRERTGTTPVLLLDDVLSELDPERRQRLLDALPSDAQALLTSALPAGLPSRLAEGATVVPVSRERSP
ncbi:MAG: DNA replication/repair protein RecF [Chloroflexi bacterium]|nr:DNA replication/repair protein RecF [Chloroflexota bacterium]